MKRTGKVGGHKCTHYHLSLDDKNGIKQALFDNMKKSGDECWNWTRHKTHGYGHMLIGKSGDHSVHRVSAYVFWGFNIFSKSHILHKCDNRACFNPDHLYEGGNLENHVDRMDRGRLKRNKENGKFMSGLDGDADESQHD